MGIMCFIYLICSIRTNMVFFMIFLTLVFAFAMLAGSFWQFSNGNLAISARLQEAAGAFAFCTTIFGWWIFTAIMLASLDFPFSVPGEFIFRFFFLDDVGGGGNMEVWNERDERLIFGIVGDLSKLIKGASERTKVSV
jgi:hypothetical protein